MKVGADYLGDGSCQFTVWAPLAESVVVKLVSPHERVVQMERDEYGYWRVLVENVPADATYLYRLNDRIDRPDPASQFQPEGVHRASQVVNHHGFPWRDELWEGLFLEEMVIYELHVGAFTPEGTFEAIISRIEELKKLGVNVIELMPISQFPGARNWGYDGVHPFAVQNSYGTPNELKRMIDACHHRGIAVLLDVVYNHLGPEGNYLADFAPYFTRKYQTPWGWALNFDGEHSDEVRNFFLENALYWLREYHFDGFRLDAIHEIHDQRAIPFLRQLVDAVDVESDEQRRRIHLIAECNLNDPRIIRPAELGGFGLSAQWNDDFHHSLRVLLTGERSGYYSDFGQTFDLAKAISDGFVLSGNYSTHRKSSIGDSSADCPAHQFIVFGQNHDQVGNRMLGERLSQLVSFEALKLAAGAVLLAPNVPMLFMGEEYGEQSPFLYFVNHGDAGLIAAVREGRKREFADFAWQGEPPDPQAPETFLRSKLGWEQRNQGRGKTLLDFYRVLIHQRHEIAAIASFKKEVSAIMVDETKRLIFQRRSSRQNEILCVMNFSQNPESYCGEWSQGGWKKLLDSADVIWGGPGMTLPEEIQAGQELKIQPVSFALYLREHSRRS
ncbi:MAG: malto-oligosyltrehalose trehalohydrolase [Acidobacteria bacterium]|nr:malto-oligosyltrehalose trehalohydrolase [Acidobacteriota bacterium]